MRKFYYLTAAFILIFFSCKNNSHEKLFLTHLRMEYYNLEWEKENTLNELMLTVENSPKSNLPRYNLAKNIISQFELAVLEEKLLEQNIDTLRMIIETLNDSVKINNIDIVNNFSLLDSFVNISDTISKSILRNNLLRIRNAFISVLLYETKTSCGFGEYIIISNRSNKKSYQDIIWFHSRSKFSRIVKEPNIVLEKVYVNGKEVEFDYSSYYDFGRHNLEIESNKEGEHLLLGKIITHDIHGNEEIIPFSKKVYYCWDI